MRPVINITFGIAIAKIKYFSLCFNYKCIYVELQIV